MNLLEEVCGELAKTDLKLSQKLLISLVCDYFDNFAGSMAKVRLSLAQSLTYHIKHLLACVTADELVKKLLTLDLRSDENKELKSMIPVTDGQDTDIKIESELYLMIKSMTHNTGNFPQKIVKIHFLERSGHGPWSDNSGNGGGFAGNNDGFGSGGFGDTSSGELSTMFITGFPDGIMDYEVRNCIEDECTPKHIRLPKDRETGELRGKGYVDFVNVNDLDRALKMRFEINGKKLYTVKVSPRKYLS